MACAVIRNLGACSLHRLQLIPSQVAPTGSANQVRGHENGEGPASGAQEREGLGKNTPIGIIKGNCDFKRVCAGITFVLL